MKNLFTYLFLLVILGGIVAQNANAQTTKTVGTTGADYATLKGAFDAINAGTITGGAITLQIIDNTTETATAVLNASGGTASYTSVNIYPTSSGLSISGDLAAPLIDLNGADHVIIDGSVNALSGGANLIISNTSVAATAGTSTIRFINDATLNTIKFCTIKGSSMAATTGGVLFLSTTTGTSGNDNNTITDNNITNAGGRPVNVIYSLGTVLKLNSGNIIGNNNFYDFLNKGLSSFGILISNNNLNTEITGNSFYETTAFVPTANVNALSPYSVIYIGGLTTNTSVNYNYIGGSTASCGGTAWTKTNAFTSPFVAINASSAASCSIQGNVISNFVYADAGASSWTGILSSASSASIGTTAGNIIGDGAATGPITITGGATGSSFTGIGISGAGNVSAENNIISSITTDNAAANASNFYGISNNGTGSISILNNSITNNNANSASTANAQSVIGINSAAGIATISGNTITGLINGTTNATPVTAGLINGITITGGSNIVSYNTINDLTISNTNNLATYQASVGGIVLNYTTTAAQSILGNTIFNLFNTDASFAGSIIGIYFNGSTTANTVSGNFIHTLSAGTSNTSNLYGIKINAGTTTYSNNIISLGDNSTATVYGIAEAGGTSNLYFNTVYVGGAPTTGALPSYALFSSSSNTRNFRNNILSNARSNSGATGKHYAISLASVTGLTIDYNDYFTSGTDGVLGFSAADVTTLVDWQTATVQDAASLNTNPLFTTAGGTLPADYLPAASLTGISGTGVLVDFNESARTTNTMGALEGAAATNTVDVYMGAAFEASYPNLVKAFNAINIGNHGGDLVVKINSNQNLTIPAVLKASGTGGANYNSVHIYPTVTGLSILGDMAMPLIDLDGADMVTIDGRVNATGSTKDLIINNISTSNAASTSTIRLVNDASNNTIQYCIIKGAETQALSGVVYFGATNGISGNDDNLIENNDITSSSDATRPVDAIYSGGQTTTGLENSGNIISANNFYNFLSKSIASFGVFIFTGNDNWTISNNSFYETTAFAPTGSVEYSIISIRVAGTFNVTGNYIGGSSAGANGTWSKSNSASNIFYGISYTPTTVTTPSFDIQGNTIRNFSWSNSLNANWSGIYIANGTGGTVNIGNTTPNTIGAATGNNSITLNNGTTGGGFYGIYLNASLSASYYFDVVNVANNVIGAITVANTTAANATNFFGIFRTCNAASTRVETYNILNNTIGSTDATTNSINATSASTGAAQTVYGISTYGRPVQIININGNTIAKLTNATSNTTVATTGLVHGISHSIASLAKYTINNNIIRDLTIANSNNTATLSASVIGIALTSSTAIAQTITGNTIYSLSNTSGTSASSIFGIYFTGGTTSSDISRNLIHSFSANPANTLIPAFYGIRSTGGVANFVNNIVTLSTDLPTTIYGFYISGTSACNAYFNTAHIGGTAPSGTSSSYAFLGFGSGTRVYKNNIFDNRRANNVGVATGKHYSLGVQTVTGLTNDNNDYYYLAATGGVLGVILTTDVTALPFAVGQDAASVSINPLFANAGSTIPAGFIPFSGGLTGTPIAGFTTDYSGATRAATPTMGAFEACVNPTNGGTIAANQTGCGTFDPVLIGSTASPTGYSSTLEYQWQNSTDNIAFVNIVGANAETYDPPSISVTTYYKRLARVSCMADWTGAVASNSIQITVLTPPTVSNAGADQYNYNNGGFTLSGNVPSVGTGLWALVSGTASITATNSETSTVSGIPAGTQAELSWTISNGSCTSVDNVLLKNISLSGIISVGPTGIFPSITNALQAIQTHGFTGTGGIILELQPSYLSSVETYPINFTSTLLTSATNPLTIRPELGATGLVITNFGALAHTINMTGANYITFDGRPGGIGTATELTIASDLAGSYLYNTIRLASSSNNVFQYCHITNSNTPQSYSPWAQGATIWFVSNVNPLFHNYDNTIDHCNIHGVSNNATGIANTLAYILSSPNTTISNNNFYDFGTKANGVSYALLLGTCDNSVITGNSFYQTATREVKYGSNVINLNGGNGYTVSGNYIGGSAPLCGGAPTTMNFNSFASGTYNAIVPYVGNTTATSIQGNIISNINAIFSERGFINFITQSMGKVDYGTVTPNVIGSLTDPNSITITNSGSSTEGAVTGFSSNSASAIDFTNFSNNIISGISLSGNAVAFTGINAGAYYTANLIITNNTIGSNTLANAITNSTTGKTIGIAGSGRNLNTITGNTIANITQSNTGINQLIGIYAMPNSGLFNVSGNNIHDLSTASSSASTGMNASLIGISLGLYNTGGQNISGNTIHSLSNTSVASTPSVIGLYYQGPGGSNTIAGNYIYGLKLTSSSPDANITGIYADNTSSVAKFYNNMIQLGIDASAQSLNTGYSLKGIYDCKGSNSFYNNSVYLGGAGVTGSTSNTYAFSSDVITNTREIKNNIFVNERSGGTTGNHYSISLAGITISPAGLTSSNNLFFTSGTNGILGHYNSADHSTLMAWQGALGQDNGSIFASPNFVNPTGGASIGNLLNLHIANPTPIEGAGTVISSVTTDFDGELRSTLTPNDIGADAGDFVPTTDVTAPSIVFVPIPSTHSTTSMTLTGFATITDNVAVSSGLNAPRIYYKKLTDANVFGGNTSANNGWKYTLATNSSSPYDFTIDYSLINGGAVNAGDVIQYFIVAQDDANNMSSNFNGATSSSTIDPIQNINTCPPVASINQYLVINNAISGTITVPGNYSSLTGPSGLFQAMNEGTVTGNVNVLITDNLVEPGTYSLNQFAAPYTLTIAPGSASLKTITANIDEGLIRLNGADRVTIDGRFAGSGKYLEFNNSGTASYLACTFLFTNMANNNAIQYVSVKGQNPLGTVIYFRGIYPNTGNSSGNTIDHCDISGTGSVGSLISSYSNVGGANTLNSITNCNLFDFYHPTNTATAISLSFGSSDWTITGNSFYQTTGHSSTNGIGVIQITDGTNHLISGNFIGGSAPLAGGTPWTSSIGNYMRIIYCYNGSGNMDITNNTIANMDIFSTSSNGFYGIDISSFTGVISGNTIGSTSAANVLTLTGTSFVGIEKIGATAMNIVNNNIGGISATTGFYGIITSGNASTNINNNIIGSTTIANSISSANGQVTGISAMHDAICSFSDNTISNLTSATGSVKGMILSNSVLLVYTPFTIERNTIRNLSGGSTLGGMGNSSSVLGLSYSSTGNGGIIKQNDIHDLANSSTTGSPTVTGIYLGSTSGSVVVSRNSIYGLSSASTDIASAITGIHIKGAYIGTYSSYTNANIQNNVIRLGDGITKGYAFTGIFDELGITSMYFNSISLSGGDSGNTDAKSSSFAIRSINTHGSNFQNNILANTRVGGTTGVNYAITVAGTAPNPAALTLNYNDYFVSATFGSVGYYNGAGVTDLAAWKTAVGLDANSISADPLFTLATNLIPLSGSPVIGAGSAIGGITTDFAGTTRVIPHTIGAYESAPCTNPTVAGTIETDQNGCTPFDPALITSATAASGENGTLEYKWQYAVAPFSSWIDIAASNTETYNPASITATTMYRRLARVTCKADWVGAAVTNAVTMTVNPTLPVSLTIAASATTVCAGTSVTYTATPVNPGANPVYQWKKNGINVGTNSPTYSVVPTNGNTITCILTSDATPCATGSPASSNTITMTVNPITQASIVIIEGINPGNVCAGTSKTFFAAPTNGGSSPIFQWKVNGVAVGSNANNYSYTPVNNDQVTCELISNITCPGTSPAPSNILTMAVTPTTASVSAAPDQNNVCAGTSVTFTATPVNGGTTPAYQWYKNGSPVATGPTYSFVPSNGDAVYVELTSSVLCVNGALATSTTVNMVVNPILPVSVSILENSNNVCAGSTVTFTASPVNGGATPSYQWYNGAVAVGTNSPTYAYAPANGDVITVVMTSSETCKSGSPATSNAVTMTVNPILTASVTIAADANNVCAGTTVTFTPTPTNGGAAPTYEWFVNTVSQGTSATYAYVPVQGDVVSAVMTSNESCIASSTVSSNTVTMTVNPILPASVTIAADANPVCASTGVTFTATPVNGGTTPSYQWYNGATAVGTDSPTYTYVPVNGDVIKVVVISSEVCQSGSPATSNSVSMVVNPILTPGVSIRASANPLVSGATVTFTPSPVHGGSAPTYQWYKNTVSMGISNTYSYTPVNGDVVYAVMTSNSSEPCISGTTATSNSVTISLETPPSGLVAYYKLDEAAGNTYFDFLGSNNGTGNPSPSALTGKVNGAQQFNGTSTKIGVNASTTFDFAATGDFSVEYWYKGNSLPASSLGVAVGRVCSTANTYWGIGFKSTGVPYFFMVNGTNSASASGSTNIIDGNWHHITGTRNGTTGVSKLYVDGTLVSSATKAFAVNFSSPTAKLEIGSLYNTYLLSGNLDEVAIHNVVLSPAEIQQHYNNGLNGDGYFRNLVPAITSVAPTAGIAGQTYSYDVNANGYPVPTYSLTTSPAGMSIDANTGLIQWTPAASGNVNVTVQASNGVNPPATQSFSIAVALPPNIPAGLVAYYKLDEAAGNTYIDFLGSNNGTGNPSPSAITGKVNGAQQFNGTSTKIGVNASTTFDFAATGDFSVEYWYKGNSLPASSLGVAVGRVCSTTNTYWGIGFKSTGVPYFFMVNGTNSASASGSTNIIDGNWHHITGTRNGTTGVSKLYVDGTLVSSATKAFAVNFTSPTAKLEIGSLYNTYLLSGNLDEVAIHNVVLTPAEIQQHYNNGLNGLGYFSNLAPSITTTAPIVGSQGQLYSYDVNANGYPVPTYSLTTSPAGMSIDANTGLIQWTPAAAGNFNVTVQASNGVNPPATQSFSIAVALPPNIPAGLVAYYKLDEAAGNTYFDFLGSNNGTGNPSPSAIIGQVNGAQQFNGTSTKIGVNASTTFDFAATGDFSVEYWYKGNSLPASSLGVAVGRVCSTANTYWGIGFKSTGVPYFFMVNGTNSASASGSTNIIDGNWHHITATRNGTTGVSKLYVDGTLVSSATKTFAVNFTSPTAKLEIGSLFGSYLLGGSLDEVAIHNVVLTPADIQQHYNNGLLGLDILAPAPAPKSANMATALNKPADVDLLSAYAFRNIEIRIKGQVKGGSLATLYDIQGRTVKTKILDEGDLNTLPIDGLNTAVYILRVNDHGKLQSFKIPINE